MTVLSDL